METIRVQIDEAHNLDIIDGETLEEQPLETQADWQRWLDETGFNPFLKVNATSFDDLGRPLTWHYDLGELSLDVRARYRYPRSKRNWDYYPTFIFNANIQED